MWSGHTTDEVMSSGRLQRSAVAVGCSRFRHLGIFTDPPTKAFLPVSDPIEQPMSFAFTGGLGLRVPIAVGTKGADSRPCLIG